ncbi:MAG: hypothetical protein WC100_01465 [Sterolibacterium sp.]
MTKQELEELFSKEKSKSQRMRSALIEIRNEAQRCDAKGVNLRNGYLIQRTTEALACE